MLCQSTHTLGMIGTMAAEGHTALLHTAAASNLGQMLQKLCIADGIDLVNIVRKPEQEKILRDIGASYVCNSLSDSFKEVETRLREFEKIPFENR